MTNKTSAAQLAASKRWNNKQYRMTLRFNPALKEVIDAHTAITGESTTAFIVRAINETMQRDKEKAAQ